MDTTEPWQFWRLINPLSQATLKSVLKATNSIEAPLPDARSIIPFLLTAMVPHTNISFVKKQKMVRECSVILEKKQNTRVWKDFVQIFTRECQGIMERTLRIYKVQSLNLDSLTYCFDDFSIYSPFTELPWATVSSSVWVNTTSSVKVDLPFCSLKASSFYILGPFKILYLLGMPFFPIACLAES